MDKRTASKIDTYQKLLAFLVENATLFAGYEPLEDDISSFKTESGKLDKLTQDKAKKNSSAAEDKGKDRSDMALLGMTLGKKASRWAKKNGKTAEQILFDVELKDLEAGKIQDSLKLANNIHDGLVTNLTALAPYKIIAANVTEFKGAIEKLELSSPQPQLAIGKNKVLGKEVFAQVKKVDGFVDDMEDLIIGEYLRTNPTLVNEFLASRTVIDPSRRKTALTMEVVNDKGEPVDLAFCDVLEMTDEEQYTDAFGMSTIKGMKSGALTLVVSKENFEDYKVPFNIKRGEKMKIKVVLKGV